MSARAALRRMANTYREYWRINVLTTLEYRTNFLLWLGFAIVYHASALGALAIVLARFPSLDGWTFAQMAFLYTFWMLAHAIYETFFSSVADVPERVRDGEFDRILVRPLDPLFQAIATPGQHFPDELVLASAAFAIATAYAAVSVTPAFVLLVPLVALGGALVDLGIELLLATLSFWFVRVDAVRWLAFQLESEFTRYPIGIYARGVRYALTFALPFAFMNYFPAAYFLHKTGATFGLPVWIGLCAPAIGAFFAAVAYAFWRFGLNRYQGVGH